MKSLAKLETASRMLAEIKTVGDARKVISLAEAACIYAREAKLGLKAENRAAEIKIWDGWKGGEMQREMIERGEREMRGGDRGNRQLPKFPDGTLPTHDDLGITRIESRHWQRMSRVPRTVVARWSLWPRPRRLD
jgi:hypothetical protein